jgi:cytochrome c biogenesis protein CcdA
MTLLIVSFLAWVLTILAPCVLPLLPVILWAWAADAEDKYRPYIIIASLSISIILFSLLLKVSTVFIWVDPIVWKLFSWVILILFWIITIFPNLWKNLSTKLWFSDKSNQNLGKSAMKKWFLWSIMIWLSLWPVFSSCSPTYAIILAVILPISFLTWLLNLFAYVLGLWLILLLIALLGQKFISKMKWVSSPDWKFKKILWVLFLVIWLAIITWYDKVIETAILNSWYFDITEIEQKILDEVEIEWN